MLCIGMCACRTNWINKNKPMKLTLKKKDAICVAVWVILTAANLLALVMTEENTYGFLMLFCLIWFLNEDREYKQKYPEKKENNQE